MNDKQPQFHIARVESGKHPFQIFMCGLCAFSGAAYLLLYAIGQAPAPRAIESTLPWWLRTAWLIMLFLGPSVVLVGTFWKSSNLSGLVTGMLIQKRGLLVTAAATLAYTVAVISYAAGTGLLMQAMLTVCVNIGFTAACWVRHRHISRDLTTIRGGSSGGGHRAS